MKKFTPNILVVLIAGVISLVFILSYYFNSCNRETQQVLVHTDTIPGDSVPVYITREKPVPVYHDTGSTHYIIKDMDSSQLYAIALDYYSKYIYDDTLQNDSSALIRLRDTVHKNRLQKRELIFQNRRPTVINYYTPASKPRNRAYIGILAGGDLKGFDFGPAALFVSKKSLAFDYRYEIMGKRHFVTIYWTPFKAVK